MATHRYISTTYWDDAWIQSLEPMENYLYLYLMTNPLTGISGIYKITDRRISFNTKLEESLVKSILEKFEVARKVFRMGEYIIIPSWPKHQNWETNSKIKQGIINELNKLNDDEIRFVYGCGYKFPMQDLLQKRKIEVKNETLSVSYTEPMDSLSEPMDSLSEPMDSLSEPMDSPPTIKFNSDSNLLNLNFIGNSNATSETPDVDNLGKTERPPPKDLFLIIKEKVKSYGFYIDEPVAKKIANSIQDQTWFTSEYSIIDLASEKINEIYSDKPKEERKKLFVSALTKWGNIQDEYPDWLKKKITAAENRALEKLRKTPPKLCPKCQTDFKGERLCPNCKGFMIFSEEEKAWKYEPHVEFGSLREEMRKKRQEKINQETAPPKDEEIDF